MWTFSQRLLAGRPFDGVQNTKRSFMLIAAEKMDVA